MTGTHRRTLRGAPPNAGGYRRLLPGPGEAHDLAGPPGTPLLTVAHLSDLHVCDAQSPARVEFLDRWSDPDSPVRDVIGEVGTYRAQEMLTAQVAEAAVRALNEVSHGPVGGAPIDLAIATGDNTDNAQANELAWYLALLDGGTVRPDSGDPVRYEGVADETDHDERYWHPGPQAGDLPRTSFGFPRVPGLLDAARRAFDATGLAMPWLAVHGNHDQLVQGTWPGDPAEHPGVAARKVTGLLDELTGDGAVAMMAGLNACDPAALAMLLAARTRAITPDAQRRLITRQEFVAAHLTPGARPAGHGFDADRLPYYRHDRTGADAVVTLLVLDTVNEHGGWQGSLDQDQFGWLRAELAAADRDERLVVLASHHPLSTMVNDRITGDVRPRVLGPELDDELSRHPSLVLWLNGHTHRTTVTPHGSWWEVTAPSLIDWPQQARVVELLRAPDGSITVAATMIDHAGEAPWSGAIGDPLALAGLSRELAANDWQRRDRPLEQHPAAGTRGDRNVLLSCAPHPARLAGQWGAGR